MKSNRRIIMLAPALGASGAQAITINAGYPGQVHVLKAAVPTATVPDRMED